VAQKRRVVEVAGGDLEGGHVQLGQEIGAGRVEGGGKEGDAQLGRVALQLDVLVAAELERLPMKPVGGAEAVLVVVGRLVHLPRVQTPVVALLQLDRVRAALPGGADQFHRLLQRPLVVVPDLGDDIAVAVVRDAGAVDDEFPHGPPLGSFDSAMVLTRPGQRRPQERVTCRLQRWRRPTVSAQGS